MCEMNALRIPVAMLGLALLWAAAPLAVQAQSRGPALAPAEYTPLPVDTRAYYNKTKRSFRVRKINGLDIKVKYFDRRWTHFYAVFARSGPGVYSWPGRENGDWEATLSDQARQAAEGLWPLKVGNKAEFEVEEKAPKPNGDSVFRTWTVSLEVTGTAYITIDGLRYPAYVVRERLQGRGRFRGDPDGTLEIIQTHWYNPDSGLVIQIQREIPEMGKLSRLTLLKAGYPDGTTNLALKAAPLGGGNGLAVAKQQAEIEQLKRAAEIQRLKQEAQMARLKQETEAALRGLRSATPPVKKKKDAGLEEIDFGAYFALVICNDDYKHLPKLQTAVNDAKAVSQTLANEYGFKVTTLINATRADIVDALDEYRESLTDLDNFLIYYAGHGWLDEEAGRGYWLPVDARKNRRSRWVSNATLTDTLKTVQAKHVMVVADSCYSGTLVRGAGVSLRSANYWRKMVNKRTRVALTSGGLEPVADKGGGNHSPFAKAFLDVLKNNDSVMDGTQMFTAMRRPIMVNANQTPEYSDVRNAGHDGGDFLFVRKN